jgi:hypothetical protein
MKCIGSCNLVDWFERMIDGGGFNFEMVNEDLSVRCKMFLISTLILCSTESFIGGYQRTWIESQ